MLRSQRRPVFVSSWPMLPTRLWSERYGVSSLTSSNGRNIISKSVARVAKKQSPDDIEGFSKKVLANIEMTTDA